MAARIDRQAVAFGYLLDALCELTEVRLAGQGEGDVFDHGQGFEQREVLEHHADAEFARVGRTLDSDILAFPLHLARTGPGDTVDDLHQRRFAGAVLAQHGMDLAGRDFEIDAVVGDHGRVDLADVAQYKARRRARGRACLLGHGVVHALAGWSWRMCRTFCGLLRRLMSWAAIAMAMTSGSLPTTAGSPTGLTMRASWSSV